MNFSNERKKGYIWTCGKPEKGIKGKKVGMEKMCVRLYDYGARLYAPVIGRFGGVDPIAEQFPHVSVYNYAENRVPNGIDLWGLQFVDANDAKFLIIGGQTWRNTGSYQSGTDYYGVEYVGYSVPFNRIEFKFPEKFNTRGMRGAMGQLQKQMNAPMRNTRKAKSTGLYDKRFRTTKNYNKIGGTIGRIGLVFQAISLGQDIVGARKSYNAVMGNDEGTQQADFVEKSWQGVVDGLNAGYFTSEQITLENLSQVADYLYRGTPIKNGGLQTVANRILMDILGMEAKVNKIIDRESGLDNFSPPAIGDKIN